MTDCPHPSETSCHSQAELRKQSRAVPPTHRTDLPEGNLRGQNNSDVWGQGIYQKIVKRRAKIMLSFPCGCRTNLFVLLTQGFLGFVWFCCFFFYSSVIRSFFRNSFPAVHQELA